MGSGKDQKDASSKNDGKQEKALSDEEVRQESSKAADACMNAQKRAKELKAAAEGAGDPHERQKLMEQAIDAEIEAESFGKTAKYLRSGAFQGMAVGAGIGIAPGATLGAVTGTLVGGVTSTITGGLGGGIGTAAGALHGPIWNLGEVVGKGVRKFTGDLPGWVASDEQKKSLEKMLGQVQEEEMPDEKELKKMHKEGGEVSADEGWMKSAKDMTASMGGGGDAGKGSSGGKEEGWMNSAKDMGASMGGGGDAKSSKSKNQEKSKEEPTASDGKTQQETKQGKEAAATSAEKTQQDVKQDSESKGHADEDAEPRKKPRKLESKSKDDDGGAEKPANDRGKPKKLEKRSNNESTESSSKHDTDAKEKAERREKTLRKMLEEHGVSNDEIESRLKEDEA